MVEVVIVVIQKMEECLVVDIEENIDNQLFMEVSFCVIGNLCCCVDGCNDVESFVQEENFECCFCLVVLCFECVEFYYLCVMWEISNEML